MQKIKETVEAVWKNKNIRIWCIFAAIFLFVFMSHCYYLDTVSLVRYEYSFADSILHGEFSNLYQRTYDVMQLYNPNHSPAYDYLMCITLGIWGIPLYFIVKILGITNVGSSFICLLYGKSILLFAICVSTYLVMKICDELSIDKEKVFWAGLAFFTSLLTLGCVAIIGQCDVLGMTVALAGVLAYLKGNNKKFLIWFMLAFPFKQYSFFVFLPLLLLREKRILKIVLKILCIFAFTFVLNIPIRNCVPAYEFKKEFADRMFGILTQNTLPLIDGIPITILLWGIVCLVCFLYKMPESKEKEHRIIVYMMFAAMAAIFIGFSSFCYWYMNMTPYLIILIFYKQNDCKELLFFETLGIFAITIVNVLKYYWCYDVLNCENMLLAKLFKGPFKGTVTLQYLATETRLSMIQPTLSAIYIICIIAVLWLARPTKEVVNSKAENSEIKKCVIYRAVFNSIVALIPMGLYLVGVLF